MSLGPAIDVAIGLIFVYLTLGLITSALQEIVANFLSSRGKTLRDALLKLLADGNESSEFFKNVFGHALVQGISRNHLPSYVPSRNFALAIIDTLSQSGQLPIFAQVEQGVAALPPGRARQSLTVLIREAAGDINALTASIAGWYDDTMDRLSGEYRRSSQLFALIAGFVLAIAFNVDSLNIAQSLWSNDTLRANVAAAAQAYGVMNAAQPTTQFNDALLQLTSLKLPIGWNVAGWAGFWSYLTGNGLGGVLTILAGWVVTGLATTLGAPFWFDLLKNVMNVRSAGPKPEPADAPVPAPAS